MSLLREYIESVIYDFLHNNSIVENIQVGKESKINVSLDSKAVKLANDLRIAVVKKLTKSTDLTPDNLKSASKALISSNKFRWEFTGMQSLRKKSDVLDDHVVDLLKAAVEKIKLPTEYKDFKYSHSATHTQYPDFYGVINGKIRIYRITYFFKINGIAHALYLELKNWDFTQGHNVSAIVGVNKI